MIYHTELSRSNNLYKKFIYILHLYIRYIYIYTIQFLVSGNVETD
jgi:hypothetical protein